MGACYLADGFQDTQCRFPRLDDGEHRLVVWQTHPGGGEVVGHPDVALRAGPWEALHGARLTSLLNRRQKRDGLKTAPLALKV